MLNTTHHLQRYGIAIASVMVALSLMLALDPFLKLTQASFLLFFGAVTISALYGGWQAGIFATLLSAVLANYFFLVPQQTWTLNVAGFLRLAFFVLQGTLISVLVGSLQTAQAQIRKSFNQLKASEVEIKGLNQALQRRVDELQTLFNVIPINIVVAEDPDCQVVRANPAYSNRLQIPPDANIAVAPSTQQSQLPYRFYQNGQEVTRDKLPLEYAAKHGVEVRDVEIDLVRHDNTIVNLYGHAVPLFDESGQTRGSIGVFTDITDRKQAEMALREREEQLKRANERFQLAARAVNCLIYDWDLTCDRIERTDGLTRLLGYTLEEAEPTGQWWADRVHPDDLQTLRAHAWTVLATEDTFTGEYRVLNKANQYIYMLDQCLVVARDTEGKPTRIVGSTTDISERKRSEAERKHAEAELQQRELEFRTLVENTPDIITRYDRDLRHLYISPKAEQAIGVPVEQIVGRTVSELGLTYSRLQDWYATVRQVFATGAPCSIETEFPRPDGELRLYQAHFVPELREEGQVTTVVSFARDITEFKRAEASLRASEERLRLATEAAQLGTWDVDLTTGSAIWSEQHFTLLGFEPVASGEASEAMWIERIHPADRERVLQTWQQTRVDHQLYQTEYRVIRADTGQIGWLAALGSFAYDSSGQAVRSLGVVFNITQRKQAEESILQLNQQLQQKVAELQTLLDVIPIGIGIAEDRQCSYIRANPAFAQLLNLPPNVNTSLTAPEAERPTAFKVYKNGQEMRPEELPLQYAAKHGVDVRELEVEIIRQDGTVITLLEYAAPLFDESGRPRGSIGAFLDITDRKQAEAERQQLLERERTAREEAERANRVKDEFLSILSHELRSPLNPILGWSRLLQAKQFDEATTTQALSTIERNARLQTQLIDDLLDVAKILRGKLNLSETPVQLVSVVEAALEIVRTAAEAKAILLVPELTDIGQVRGDSARLQQIVWNLLSNAVKFTANGGRVVVRLEQVGREEGDGVRGQGSKGAEEQGSKETLIASSPHLLSHPSTHRLAYAQITVTDTGKGINPAFLPHIFESFRQEDVSITRRYGGLGLGLSIVKYLVDAHGGTITAESPGEGQGATFTVRLPLLDRKVAISTTERLTPTKIDLVGIKVLAVDDSEDSRELLEILLAQYGAETKVVASGKDLLALLGSFKPQVLVCDIGMPDMDGYMLLQRVRVLPPDQGGNTPAIALTAYAKEEDYQRALAYGFQRHIAKPVDPERLATAIAELARR